MDAHETELKRAGPAPSIVIGALLAVAGIMIGVRIREDRTPRATRSDSPPAAVARVAPAVSGSAWTPRAALPDPVTLAALLDDVSAHRPVRALLHEPDWLVRAIRATGALAEGRVPREILRDAAPAAPFSVERTGRAAVVAAASYHRYDAFADAVGGISPAAVRALFVALREPIDEAAHLLRGRSAAFDTVAMEALLRVEAAPSSKGTSSCGRKAGRSCSRMCASRRSATSRSSS